MTKCTMFKNTQKFKYIKSNFLDKMHNVTRSHIRHYINDKTMRFIMMRPNKGQSSEYHALPELGYYLIGMVYAELLLPLVFGIAQTWMSRVLERLRKGSWICCCWSLWHHFHRALTMMNVKSGKLIIFATSITIASIIGAKCIRVTQFWPIVVATCQSALMCATMPTTFFHASHSDNQLPQSAIASNGRDERMNQTSVMPHGKVQPGQLYCSGNKKSCSQHCGNMYQQHNSAIFIDKQQHQLQPKDKGYMRIVALVTAKWLTFQRYFTANVAENRTESCRKAATGNKPLRYDFRCCCSACCSHDRHSLCCSRTYCRSCKLQTRGCETLFLSQQWQQGYPNCWCCCGSMDEMPCCGVCCTAKCCWPSNYVPQSNGKEGEANKSKTILNARYAACSYCCCCWCGFCCTECCYCNSGDATKCAINTHRSYSLEQDETHLQFQGEQVEKAVKQEREGNSLNCPEFAYTSRRLTYRRNGYAAGNQYTFNGSGGGGCWHNSNISENLKLQLIMQYHRNLLALQSMVHAAAAASYVNKSQVLFSKGSTNRPSVAKACRQRRPQLPVAWNLWDQHRNQHQFSPYRNNFTGNYHRLVLCCCVANEQQLKTNNLCKIFCNNRKRHRRRLRGQRRPHWLRHNSNCNNNKSSANKNNNSNTKSSNIRPAVPQDSKYTSERNVKRSFYKIGEKPKKVQERIENLKSIIALNIFKAITGFMALTPPISASALRARPMASATTTASMRVRVSFASGSRAPATSDVEAAMSATSGADITALIPYSLMCAATTTIAIATPTATAAVLSAANPPNPRIYKRRVKSNLVWLFIGLVWFESPKLANCNMGSGSACNSQSSHPQHQHEKQQQKQQQQHEIQQQQQKQHIVAIYPWAVTSIGRVIKSEMGEYFISNRNCTNTFKTNYEKRQAIVETQDRSDFEQISNKTNQTSVNNQQQQPKTRAVNPAKAEFTETKKRNRRHFDGNPVTNEEATYDKQEQVSTALNDLARLESIKRQILSKLGLSHKPNVVHPLPKQFIWDTIYRADGIRSVNDFDFIANDRTIKHIQRAHYPSRRTVPRNRHRKGTAHGYGNEITNENYEYANAKKSRRKNTNHRSKHVDDTAANKMSYTLYHNNNKYSNSNTNKNTRNTLLDDTQNNNGKSTHHIVSNHNLNNLSSSDMDSYGSHHSDYNNQNIQNYFKTSKTATYLFSNDLDGDVGSDFTKGLNYNNIHAPEPDDLEDNAVFAQDYDRTDQSPINGMPNWGDDGLNEVANIPNLQTPYYHHTDGVAEHGLSDLGDADNFGENEDFFGNTQEIITFAEKGTDFWHHRLVEFSKQINAMPNQKLFIRNAEIHIRIDKVAAVPGQRKSNRERANLNIWIFQLVDKNYTQKSFDQVTRLCTAFTVNTKNLGWQKLDITRTVQEWYSNDVHRADKLRLLIDCSGCGKHYVLHLFDNPKEPSSAAKHHHHRREDIKEPSEPQLSQLKANQSDTFSLIWKHSGNKSYRYKYYKGINRDNRSDDFKLNDTNAFFLTSHKSNPNPNRPFIVLHTESKRVRRVRRRAIDCMGASHGQCCKESFYVSFKALGWDDWIIAPRGYFANYCRGDCTGPFRTPDTFQTFHAHFIEEYRKMGLLNGMQPCCAPVKFSSMSLIYYGDEGIIKRDLPKMVVDECGCP